MVKIRTEKISKNLYHFYIGKADEFYQLLKHAEAKSLWNGAGLNAVHCVISSCDALTTFYLGERSRGEKHEDVIDLLKRINIKEVSKRIRQLSSILGVKNLVEYEAREFYKEDALKIATQAERFYNWVKDQLPG